MDNFTTEQERALVARLRAEKAEAESESRRQMLTEKATELRTEWIRAEKAEAESESRRAQWIRAEKAEAEAENLRAELGQRVAEAENRLDSERARADRYLAAITEMIDAESQAHNACWPPAAVLRYLAALDSIRAIVEEARRG